MRFLLLAALLAASALTARAQEDPQDRPLDPALPDIAPREVEIRGQLEIAFPALERQPLTGFGAPARVPTLPPDRQPLIGEGAQQRFPVVQELPGRDAPPRLALQPAPQKAELEFGGGRYFSRFGRLALVQPLTLTETFSLEGQYQGLDGHEPFPGEEDVRTPFDAFEGTARFGTDREGFAVEFALDGFYDDYTLFGAQRTPTSRVVRYPERRGYGAGGTLALEAKGVFPAHLDVRYGQTHFETETLPGEAPPFNAERTEQRLDANAHLRAPIGDLQGRADASFSIAGLDTGGSLEGDVTRFDGGAGVRLASGPEYDLAVGARLLTYAARAGASGTYVAPNVQLTYYLQEGLTLYAENRPGAEANSLAGLYRENPYLADEPAMQPTVYTTRAEAGVRFFQGLVQLDAHAGFRHAPSFLYFENTAAEGYRRGLTAARYGSAQILEGGGEVALQRIAGVQASLSLTGRSGRLTSEDTTIPYFAPVTAEGQLSYALPAGRGLVQLVGTFESARYVSAAEEEKVGAFFNLDARAEIALTSALGAVLRVENIAGRGALERWDRYPLSPLIISTGLRVRF